MKRIKEAIEKYILTIMVSVFLLVGGAVWDYTTRFFSIPSKMEKFETILRNDSIRNARRDSALNAHRLQIIDAYDELILINQDLQDNGIR